MERRTRDAKIERAHRTLDTKSKIPNTTIMSYSHSMNQKILFSHDKKRAVNISEHAHGWTGRLYVNCNRSIGNGLGDATLQVRHANKLETIKRWASGVFKQ